MSSKKCSVRKTRLNLADCELFINVVEARNLTRGAKKSYLSAPAASHRIRALEQEIGTQLLYRESTGVTLTAAGKIMLRHARILLSQSDHMRNDINGQDGQITGHIRIFGNVTSVTELVPLALSTFLLDYPDISIDLLERPNTMIARGVADRSADLGVMSGETVIGGLDAIHFCTDHLVLVTSCMHPLAQRKSIRFAETVEYDYVGLSQNSTLQNFLNDKALQAGLPLSLRVQVRSFSPLGQLIEAGVGIGVMSLSSAAHYARHHRISIIRLSDPWAVRERYILARDLELLPSYIHAFIDTMKETEFF